MATSGPSHVSERDIQKIIDEYLKNVPPLLKRFISAPPFQEENLMFNIFGQQKYLLISKFELSKLPVRILIRLPVYLIRQFVIQVELDSLWYWALTHDIVETSSGYRVFEKWPLMPAFNTLMAAHFARLGSIPTTPTIDRLNRIINDAVSEPVKDLVSNKHMVLMYVCYPVLEGLVKFAMSSLIDPNGRVITGFSDGKESYKTGDKISSLAILLRSLEVNASKLLSKPDLGVDLKDFRLQMEKIIPPKRTTHDGWDTVYGLRNVSLHGVIGWQLRSGLITNLICLIIWHLMDDKVVSQELQRIATRPKHFFWPRQYYPPEL